MSNLGLN